MTDTGVGTTTKMLICGWQALIPTKASSAPTLNIVFHPLAVKSVPKLHHHLVDLVLSLPEDSPSDLRFGYMAPPNNLHLLARWPNH